MIESAFAAIHSDTGEDRAPPGSRIPNLRLASLPREVTADTVSAGNARQAATPTPAADRDPFDERFNSIYEARSASFDERFAAAAEADREPAQRAAQRAVWLAPANVRLQTADREEARLAMRRLEAEAPAKTQTAPAETQASLGTSVPITPNKPVRLAYAPSDVRPSDLLAPGRGNRTAVYDIAARVVYMPNGDKLEAHSGYGEHMDDLRSVAIRNLGVTPPNVYKLSLRESLFHGVRAVRLTPVGPSKTYGRDGFLVHPYMLGPNGQSNGCVSIDDYPKFLNAFLKGDVDRLVVVERLTDPPPAQPASGSGSLVERIKAFFRSS
jgi:hypothetical protein